MPSFAKDNAKGILLCFAIAVPCWWLGTLFPVVGGPVLGIMAGMIVALFFKNRSEYDMGISFTSKKILQAAVVLLGFGLDLRIVAQTGAQSLPIIVLTISASLIVAYLMHRILKVPSKISILVGVGSSICGGSAIAATAPVVDADDEEVAQAMSVIFLFNLIAALAFPAIGAALGFSTTSGEAFGIFSGTAVNDTSSVTATAASWDAFYGLGTATLDKAVTVKLTRTLAIIPITLVLALFHAHHEKDKGASTFSFKRAFPMFLLWFVLASLVTTILSSFGLPTTIFAPLKDLSKFFIIMAMAAIGLNTDIVKLVRTGGKPIALGFCCWIGIIATSLVVQHLLGIW
ncbi:MAG: YeiH family putative sulfate export transporter [Coriobacteriaceae bacterium]|nr:YeiH family putative sulfate export transporter [Coriobacteriaceae bacterium]